MLCSESYRTFFGIEKKVFYKFDEAKKIVQKMNIRSSREYRSLCKNDEQLYKGPHEAYKDQWKGWDDFLGKEKK